MKAPWWQALAEALGLGRKDPKEVTEALEQDWDLEEYKRTHGGEAPPDAPHIKDDGTI